MISERIGDELRKIAGADRVIKDAPMSKYTSFRAGGKADFLVDASSGEKLQEILRFLSREDIPHMILGNGSNVLVRDGGYRGVIVRMGEAFNYMRIEDSTLICGSGVSLAMAAKAAANASLSGLEFASGIPGSVGGGVFMNAGAYGGEIRNILKNARLISGDGSAFAQAGPDELEMGYRHTRLHETGEIVTEAAFELEPGDPKEILALMADLTARRNEKQPVTYPSAGSFFKRPEGYFAGKLIQDAGLKGLSVGGAQVSQLHSGFIINTGGASATDILQLMQIVQARVLDQFGVALEPEVRIIGE